MHVTIVMGNGNKTVFEDAWNAYTREGMLIVTLPGDKEYGYSLHCIKQYYKCGKARYAL